MAQGAGARGRVGGVARGRDADRSGGPGWHAGTAPECL